MLFLNKQVHFLNKNETESKIKNPSHALSETNLDQPKYYSSYKNWELKKWNCDELMNSRKKGCICSNAYFNPRKFL